MEKTTETELLRLLKLIREEVRELRESPEIVKNEPMPLMVFLVFKGAEIYLLIKAFIDSGGAPHENYKSLIEKLIPNLANKTQRGFSPKSMMKFSDKVDPESKEQVKRFLMKMIRNIDSYE